MNKLKVRDVLLLMVVGVPLLILLLAIFTNMNAFHSVLGEIHSAIITIALGAWDGIIMLFFTGLILGSAWAVIRLRQMAKVREVGPGKHGYVQALVVNEGKGVSRIEHLQNPTMDPQQQIELLHQIMKVAAASAQSDQRMLALLAKQQQMVPQIEPPKESQGVESIPAVIPYEEIADEIPPEMSLLGIHPEDGSLELTAWEKLKCLWIVGSSSSGKSNTVFGKAKEAKDQDAKFAIVDQHIVKPDSLGRKMLAYEKQFLRPIAVSDDEVLATLAWFKTEFERRVHCPVCARGGQCQACAQKIVLICDEMNRMNRNERLRKPLQEIVAICGEESRGFGMYGWFLSQKCAGLKWLRDAAITVIVHRLTRIEEALLACNEDRAAARKLLGFKVGRTYVYGVDFDEMMELQQALYSMPKNDHPGSYPDGEPNTGRLLPYNLPSSTTEKMEVDREGSAEAGGSDYSEKDPPTNASAIKELREIGKRLRSGEDPAKIVKSYGLPYGRATQELSAVVQMMAQQIDAELAEREEEDL